MTDVHAATTPTKPSRNRTGAAANAQRPRSIAELDRRTLDKLDRRSVEYRRYEAIRGALISDLGGEDEVTTAVAQIADKAAFIAMTLEGMQITALSGEEIDLQRYGELTDRLRRNLESVGLERRARDVTPTLEDIFAEHEAERRAAAAVDSISPAPVPSSAPDANLLTGDAAPGAAGASE